jgi:hypothetical protein
VGEVIAKLSEDAYFMRVDNRVSQVPPVRTHEARNDEANSRSPSNGGGSRVRGQHQPNRSTSRASAAGHS